MVNCHKVMEQKTTKTTKIANVEIVSNLNELKDKISQVDKLLDVIRRIEISIQIKPFEFSQEVHR